MPIPLAQLQTWSAQGSVTQSKDTYAAIKTALENPLAMYTNRDFKVFLQGSYGNDTNIYAESDVDVVIRYDGAFFHDIQERPTEEQSAFRRAFPLSGTYPYSDFVDHVTRALRVSFGNAVTPGNKAIRIEGNGHRRNADVIAAFEFRRFYRFRGFHDDSHVKGMCFFDREGKRIANYPQLHSRNLTWKHQATRSAFKPMVRVFKNARSRLVAEGLIEKGSAPSYYIEGLLYNVPNEQFVGNHGDMFLNVLNWLYETQDRVDLVCANEQYYLLRDNAETCWSCADGRSFIDAVIRLWNDW